VSKFPLSLEKFGATLESRIFGLLPRDLIFTIVDGKTSGTQKGSPFFGTKDFIASGISEFRRRFAFGTDVAR
jgi:hypothetical protein